MSENLLEPDIYWGEDKAPEKPRKKSRVIDGHLPPKKCIVCGDKFRPNTHQRKHCSDTCARISKRKATERHYVKTNGKEYRLHKIDTCIHCGEQYLVTASHQKYCPKCRDSYSQWSKGWQKMGNTITCFICGQEITRDAPKQKCCRDKCESDGRMITCACCGKEQPATEFYDYRGTLGTRPHFIRTCRTCLIKRNTKRGNDND